MAVGAQEIGGVMYYFDANGRLVVTAPEQGGSNDQEGGNGGEEGGNGDETNGEAA